MPTLLIPFTAGNIPKLLLADPKFEQSTKSHVVFWHIQISWVLQLFQLLQSTSFIAVSPQSNDINSAEKTHQTGELFRSISLHLLSLTLQHPCFYAHADSVNLQYGRGGRVALLGKERSHQSDLHGLSLVTGILTGTWLHATAEPEVQQSQLSYIPARLKNL
jgi:hypothetical protein